LGNSSVLQNSNTYPPYRFHLGDTECTVVSDGPLDLGPPAQSFPGVSEEEIREQLARNFLPIDTVLAEQNILIVQVGGKRVLFETGMGAEETLFGTNSGRLFSSLERAGIAPESVDAIACSHPHPDHIGGICSPSGEPRFPNAQIYLSKKDFSFWTDEKLLGTKADAAVKIARSNLLPVRDRLVFFEDGEEFLPGVQAMYTPGHTAEHTCFILTAKNQSLALIGDVSHHPVLLLERPRNHFVADLDPKQAAASRVRLFAMLAEKRMPILGYHFPWPGIGHVAAEGDGFRYVPEAVRWTAT
jgi:glyoxylase-like metal-dependent hydrolase (beta-lactamase superfamily II)